MEAVKIRFWFRSTRGLASIGYGGVMHRDGTVTVGGADYDGAQDFADWLTTANPSMMFSHIEFM